MLLQIQWAISLVALGVGIGETLAYFCFRLQNGNRRKIGGGEKQQRETLLATKVSSSVSDLSCSEPESNEIRGCSSGYDTASDEEEWSEEEEELYAEMRLKMVFVIRSMSPKLSPAEAATSVSQAAVSVIEDRILHKDGEKKGQKELSKDGSEWSSWYKWWRRIGCAKITLKGPDDDAKLEALLQSSQESHLPVKVINSSGAESKKIQLEPKHHEEKTNGIVVIAIGPAPSSKIDPITGKLKLLS